MNGGGILGKLLGRIAGNSGDDIVRSVVSNYGDDVVRNLSTNYGDDVAKNVLSSLTNVAEAPTVSQAAKEFSKSAKGFGNQTVKSKIQKIASANVDDAYIKKYGSALSNDTIKRGRTMSPKYTDKSYFKILEEDGVSPANIDKYAEVAKKVGTARDEVIAAADSAGNPGRGKEVLGIFQDAYNTTNFGKTTFKNTGKDYAKNYLKELANDLDDKGNISLGTLRKTSTRLQSKANDLKTLADKGGANAEENLAMSDYLKKIQTGIDDYIDNITENSVNGAQLQKQTLEILQGAGVHPQTLQRIAAINPEEFKVSTMKSIMSPYVFAGSEMANDIARAKPAGGSQILGIPGTEPIGNAMKSGANNAVYSLNKMIAGEGGGSGAVNKALKYGALGIGGLGVLGSLTGGGEPVDTSMVAQPQTSAGQSQSTSGSGIDTTEELTVGGYNRQQLENAYVAALMDNNADGADAISSMIDMLDNKEAAVAKETKTTASDGKVDPAAAVSTLKQSWQKGGGSQGIISGNITNVLNTLTGGNYNPNAATYEDLADTLALTLAKLAGNTGAPSDTDRAKARNMLPKVTDSKEKAAAKWFAIDQLLAQSGS